MRAAINFDVRDERTVQDELIFKYQLFFVSTVLGKELTERAHASHIGTEACIRRARDTVFWPRMTTELKEYISKCDVCLAHLSGVGKKPIQHQEFVA